MTTLLLSHPASLDHETPRGHPERADRMRAVEAALGSEAFAPLLRELAPEAAHEAILRCHPETHLSCLLYTSPSPRDRG